MKKRRKKKTKKRYNNDMDNIRERENNRTGIVGV